MLSEVINFLFKSKVKKCIGFAKTTIYWTSRGSGRRYFTKQSLVNAMSFLTNKCFFSIGNMVFKQDIGIQMGIDNFCWCGPFSIKYLRWLSLSFIGRKTGSLRNFVVFFRISLREMCLYSELFCIRIFLHSDWIRKDTPYLSLFNPNAGIYGTE